MSSAEFILMRAWSNAKNEANGDIISKSIHLISPILLIIPVIIFNKQYALQESQTPDIIISTIAIVAIIPFLIRYVFQLVDQIWMSASEGNFSLFDENSTILFASTNEHKTLPFNDRSIAFKTIYGAANSILDGFLGVSHLIICTILFISYEFTSSNGLGLIYQENTFGRIWGAFVLALNFAAYTALPFCVVAAYRKHLPKPQSVEVIEAESTQVAAEDPEIVKARKLAEIEMEKAEHMARLRIAEAKGLAGVAAEVAQSEEERQRRQLEELKKL